MTIKRKIFKCKVMQKMENFHARKTFEPQGAFKYVTAVKFN